jgi:hypothetical protein
VIDALADAGENVSRLLKQSDRSQPCLRLDAVVLGEFDDLQSLDQGERAGNSFTMSSEPPSWMA